MNEPFCAIKPLSSAPATVVAAPLPEKKNTIPSKFPLKEIQVYYTNHIIVGIDKGTTMHVPVYVFDDKTKDIVSIYKKTLDKDGNIILETWDWEMNLS